MQNLYCLVLINSWKKVFIKNALSDKWQANKYKHKLMLPRVPILKKKKKRQNFTECLNWKSGQTYPGNASILYASIVHLRICFLILILKQYHLQEPSITYLNFQLDLQRVINEGQCDKHLTTY